MDYGLSDIVPLLLLRCRKMESGYFSSERTSVQLKAFPMKSCSLQFAGQFSHYFPKDSSTFIDSLRVSGVK